MNLPGISSLLRLPRTDSTQDVARLLADKGAGDRTLVWADSQVSGRGRLKRKWESPEGGLYFSLILKPHFAPTRLADLSLASAQAAAAALERHAGIAAKVKPPNDVLAVKNGSAKKICGILIEAAGGSRELEWVVVGVGINVNVTPRGQPEASSLKELTGRSWDLTEVLSSFLKDFFKTYRDF